MTTQPAPGSDPAETRSSRRRHGALTTITVVTLALAAVGVILAPRWLTRGGGEKAGARQAAVDSVVRDGDTVTGTGRVVAATGSPVRFCASVPRPAIGLEPGRVQPIERCEVFGVDVAAANLTQLGNRREVDGVVEGYAALTGVLRGGTLTVTRQSPAEGYGGLTPGSAPDHVPCPPPDQGWPPGQDDLDISRAVAYADAHPGEVVQTSLQRPAVGRTVLVVAARDPVATRAALLPSFGQRLCVFRSPYTATEVAAAHRRLSALVGPHGLWAGGGITVGPTGHPQVTGDGMMLTPALAKIADSFPPGLVRFDTWLTKVR